MISKYMSNYKNKYYFNSSQMKIDGSASAIMPPQI